MLYAKKNASIAKYSRMKLAFLGFLAAASIVAASTSSHQGWRRDAPEPSDDEIRCEIGRDSCIGHAVNGHVSGGMATCTREYSKKTTCRHLSLSR